MQKKFCKVLLWILLYKSLQIYMRIWSTKKSLDLGFRCDHTTWQNYWWTQAQEDGSLIVDLAGLEVKRPDSHWNTWAHHPALTPKSSFLLTQTPGHSSNGSSNWVPATYRETQVELSSGSWLENPAQNQPSQAIWAINQQISLPDLH